MIDMVEFLQNENDHFDTIEDTLAMAAEINVDASFVGKVRRVFESVRPRVLARDSLRRAVEYVHRSQIEEAVRDLLDIQRLSPGFAETEVRCARSILKLLQLESSLLSG